MKAFLDIQEFFVEGPRLEGSSHVLLHVSEPDRENEEQGYFFALCEMDGAEREHITALQEMIDQIETGYYESDFEGDTHPFETTVTAMNGHMNPILTSESLRMHCFVGVMTPEHIIFATHGTPRGYVMYPKKDGYKMIHLIKEQPDAPEEQLFSSVTQGPLSPNDIVCILTPRVLQHITPSRIQTICTSRSVQDSATYIQQLLTQLRTGNSFGGIIFSPQLPPDPTILVHKKQQARHLGSEASLNSLLQTQQETADTLAPQIATKTKKLMSNVMGPQQSEKPSSMRSKRSSRSEDESVINAILIGTGKAVIFLLRISLFCVKKIGMFLFRFVSMLFLFTTNYGKQRQQVIAEVAHSINAKKRYIQDLPFVSKVLFIAMLLCIGVFAGSIILLQVKEKEAQKITAYTQQMQAVQDKKDAADARLIYGDTPQALTLLQEATALLTAIEPTTDDQTQKIAALQQEVNDVLNTLEKKTLLVAANTFSISTAFSNAKVDHIEKIGDTILASGIDDTTSYSINTVSGQVEAIPHESIPGIHAATTPKEQDKIVFVTKNNTIAEFDPQTKGISQKEITYPLEGAMIDDLLIYNRKLYTLNAAGNQIYKHNQTQLGYDKGTPWISSPDSVISNATSLAVDGDIFVLENTGIVSKFSAGKKQDFGIQGLYPSLTSGTELWTYADVPYIYILDQTSKRVILVNKEQGTVVSQYTAENWQSPSSMVVDYDAKKLYVLDTNTVYQFSL